MSKELNPVVLAIIERQSDMAQRLAAAMMSTIQNGADPIIRESGRLLREAKELAQESAPLMLEREQMRLQVNAYMNEHCPKTMWTAIDVQEMNPALGQAQLDINTRANATSERLRALTDQAHAARINTYKAVGKIACSEFKQRQFPAEGPALDFVTAHLASGIVREEVLSEKGVEIGNNMLNEFFRYASLAHGKATGVNFFENNGMAEVICKGVGLKTAKEARAALYEAFVEQQSMAPAPQENAPAM